MNPTVSVIIPCYRQGKYLQETLTSVKNQFFADWECIVINDGSTDETEMVAQSFCEKDSRFIYIYQNNAGVSAARNNGLAHAKGDFIQFLDGDDLLEPNKISAQVDFLYTHSQVDIVYGSGRYFFDGNVSDLYAVHADGTVPSIEMNFKDKNQSTVLAIRNVAAMCVTLYRKKVFQNLKFKPVVFEDYLLHIECALNNFIFHYERHQNAFCLIRMTTESQMYKHTLKNNKTNEFELALKSLFNEYNYIPKITRYGVVTKKTPLYRRIINNILPPILFKMYRLTKKHIKI